MLGDLGLASAVLTFLSESPRRSKPMARGAETQLTSRTRNGHELGPGGEAPKARRAEGLVLGQRQYGLQGAPLAAESQRRRVHAVRD